MKRALAFCITLACAGLAPIAHAGLLNDSVKVDYYYPDLNSHYETIGQGTVDADGLDLPQFQNYFGMRITDRQILVDFTTAAKWSTATFNGFVLTDSTNALPQFSVDAGSNMGGFSAANLSVVGNQLYVNWNGLDFTTATQVVLDVQDAPSNVPEPMSLSLLGLGLLGLGATRRLRK